MENKPAATVCILGRQFQRGMFAPGLLVGQLRGGHMPANTYDETDVNTAWEVINQLASELKREQRPLRVCLHGGRRMFRLRCQVAAVPGVR